MLMLLRRRPDQTDGAPIVAASEGVDAVTPVPGSLVPPRESSGASPLPTAEASPPPVYTSHLGSIEETGTSASSRGEVWSITLVAFWVAVLCCAAIVAFVFLAPKKVVVLPRPEPTVFTLGSTRQQVMAVQGEPTAVEGNAWRYGSSSVYFDGNLVVGWRMLPENPLKVQQPPPRKK